jgi:cyclophilin family peptidyl-prolyl cis-trans isomerase/HEAT repeat protein
MRRLWILALAGCIGPAPDPPVTTDTVREIEGKRAPESDRLVQALDDPALAARAALAMGRIQSKAYLPALAKAARPGHPAGAMALWAIGQIAMGVDWRKGDGETHVDAVAARLDDANINVRAQAAAALGKLGGARAVGHLHRAMRDPAADVRVAAVDGLWRSFSLHQEKPAPGPLAELAADPDEEVRWHVAYAFARFEEKHDCLKALAKDANRWARMFAARALADGTGLEDAEYPVRLQAVKGAKEIPDAILRDPSHLVRMTAAPRRPKDFLDDFSPDVRAAAVAALEDPSPYLAHLDWRIRAAAAWKTRDIAKLKAALQDPERRVALAAIEALGEMADAGSGELLERLVSHGDVAVEWTAMEALAKRKAGAGALARRAEGPVTIAFEPLIDALQAAGAREPLRRLAARPGLIYPPLARRALSRLGEEVAAPRVEERALANRYLMPPIRGKIRLDLVHEKGTMRLLLDADAAPENVAHVVALARRGYYNGLEWHRLVPNFVIQGGDPRNDGWGDPGTRVLDEVSPLPHARGAVGISRMARDTGDCQLYITHVPTPHLDGRYTVIGYVIEGLDVVDRIERGDRILTARVVE